MVNTPSVSELDPVRIAGQQVRRFQIRSSALVVEVMEYGATVLSVNLREPDGDFVCLTRGLARPEDYAGNTAYMGAICGRYAGRIANASFDMPILESGATERVKLTENHGKHQLHGGHEGFNSKLWSARPHVDVGRAGVEFRYLSPDGEEGYPGTLETQVRYSIDAAARLFIEYVATAIDKPTPVNLTNHCYWNLGNEAHVLDHELKLAAQSVLEFDDELLPTGVSLPTQGTALDFSQFKPIAEAHAALPSSVTGLDHALHNFLAPEKTAGRSGGLPKVAEVRDPQSGRSMQVFSDQPVVVLYAGSALDGSANHGGHGPHSGFCIECQQFPDAPNQPGFPSPFIGRDSRYQQSTMYELSGPTV